VTKKPKPRKPGGGSPRIDWDAAFAYYAAEPTRTYAEVAETFNVSTTSVAKHSKAERWADKREAIQSQARERAGEKIVRSRAERIADTIELVDLVRQKLLADVKAGELDAKLGDAAPLVKLEALLEGEATDRIDLAEVQSLLRDLYAKARSTMTPEQFAKFVEDADRLGEAA
jgi:hypothetical protein